MQTTVQDLGKLKRSIAIEISLDEMKSSYDDVLTKIKGVKVRGFRPGKFPKGWLEKRFKEYMTHEALEKIVPEYYQKALEEKGLQAATQAKVGDITFDRKSPLSVTLNFEIKPELSPLDYTRFSLEKKEVTVTEEEVNARIEAMRKSEAVLKNKAENAVAATGDQVTIDYVGTIDGEPFEDCERKGAKFELGGRAYPEFSPHVEGMKVSETKEVSIELPESFESSAGKTAQFRITLSNLQELEAPELDEAFYKKFEKSNNEEFRQFVEESLHQAKREFNYSGYREAIRTQLPALYGEFDLPEELLQAKEEALAKLHHDPKDATEEGASIDKPGPDHKAELENFKKELRLEYILDSVAKKESVPQNTDKVFERFTQMAMLFGGKPSEFIKTETGQHFYNITVQSVYEEEILNFIVAQVVGEPLELPVDSDVNVEAPNTSNE
ncbi:trigger factor [Deltaproteobacteria bacterium TL4]